ncbi:hypothetical protein FOZ60_007259 [Perkinsus olseni]|uniref:50S ribosomal protein L33 n=1 Tax=Perkinsus olseni TaxID=32597 RepID=A0A7J6NLT7_PEROL|nr:hypothetical protein FOZ60_007259 [Perkinsus olseni]
MLFLSTPLLRTKSQRITVIMYSAAQTGYRFVTDKSPTKKDLRMALRKHDPIANKHVMFYEGKLVPQPKQWKNKARDRWNRLVGRALEPQIKTAKGQLLRKGRSSLMSHVSDG